MDVHFYLSPDPVSVYPGIDTKKTHFGLPECVLIFTEEYK
jgi:hypothetical protein